MKTKIKTILLFLITVSIIKGELKAQNNLQYLRPSGKDGLNVFEDPKADTILYERFKVRIGADFALQFQAINHTTGSVNDTLVELGNNFNLPTANLNLDVQLADGLRVHIRTYLSSRHHNEAWVKGGHVQVDKLDFISKGFLENVMKYISIRAGLDEINYGDAHFRRTDNARAIYNPFAGNYIMDAFSTEAFSELYFQGKGLIGMLAISNGKLNQSVVKAPGTDYKPSFYGKLGYDNNFTNDFRFRLTGSWYINNADTRKYIYGGDRGGSRYYNVMETTNDESDFSGRFNPGFNQLTAIQINPFINFKGLEFFGIAEFAKGGSEDDNEDFIQLAGELLYRFGRNEKFYVGGRYNLVTGRNTEDDPTQEISRINAGGGWFITNNVVVKIEYLQQAYSGDGWSGTVYEDGKFNGLMFETSIGF
ncbi:MAG: hypothetical protein JW894_15685 [Bacteroidales bacterium]|nr:hypothetical protein [Bacteroidales bacterium]